MKFAHLADVHIGAWKHPELAELPNICFLKALSIALEREVDFILIAGDLFDSALPSIHHLKSVVRSLRMVKKAKIPVYTIPGSHDFSPTGKSMLHVLEEAGLTHNVYKGEVVDGRLRLSFTQDPKTGVLLTGILGRKGSLETQQYEDLDREWIEQHKTGRGIFMFHSSLDELTPPHLSHMHSTPVSMLPKGFEYYAGGHIHITEDISLSGYGTIAYPGPVFPANFLELEKLGGGSMIIVEDGKIERVSIPSVEVATLTVQVKGTAEEATSKILDSLTSLELTDNIVLLRIIGELEDYSNNIDFTRIQQTTRDARVLLRNTQQLISRQMEHKQVETGTVDEIEKKIFTEFSHGTMENEVSVMQELLRVLSREKREGETNSSYEERILDDAKHLLHLDE